MAFLPDGIKSLLDVYQELLRGPFDQTGMHNSTLWGNIHFSVLALESTASWMTSVSGMYGIGGLLLPVFLSYS